MSNPNPYFLLYIIYKGVPHKFYVKSTQVDGIKIIPLPRIIKLGTIFSVNPPPPNYSSGYKNCDS